MMLLHATGGYGVIVYAAIGFMFLVLLSGLLFGVLYIVQTIKGKPTTGLKVLSWVSSVISTLISFPFLSNWQEMPVFFLGLLFLLPIALAVVASTRENSQKSE